MRRSARALSRCIPRAAKILMIFNIDSNLIFSASLELRRPPGTSSGLDHLYEGEIRVEDKDFAPKYFCVSFQPK